MKQKIILFSTSVCMLGLALSSYNNGPALSSNGGLIVNGAPVQGAKTCGQATCHTSASSATAGSFIKMEDTTFGWTADSKSMGYVQGHTYRVTLEGANPSYTRWGFQVCALTTSGAKNAGTMAAAMSQTAVRNVTVGTDVINVVEHSSPLVSTSGVKQIQFYWTAPAATAGSVTLYGIVNAVSGDTPPASTGDQVSAPFNLVLKDATSISEVLAKTEVTVFPNPLRDQLNVSLGNGANGDYTITAFDLNGKKMFEEQYTYGGMPFTYNTSGWPAGMYHVQILKDGMKHTTPVVKY